MDSDDTSVAGTQGESSSTLKENLPAQEEEAGR